MHYIYGGYVWLLMDWVTIFSIISCSLMKISFDQPFWIVTYFFFLFSYRLSYPYTLRNTMDHQQGTVSNVPIIIVYCSFIVVHTYLVMILYFIPKYPLVIQLVWLILTHCNRYSFYYAALISLIAHLSSSSCSQLGKSVDCTTCRFQMTNSIF